MKKHFLLFLAFALSVPSVSHALPGADIDISVGISKPTASGSITLDGTSYNVANDFNLGAGSDVMARVDISHSIPVIPNIYIHHLPVEVKGSKGGLNSELKILQDDIGLYYHLPFIATVTDDMLDVKLGLNARFISFTAATEVSSVAAEAKFSAPVPMIFLGLDFKPIHLISLVGEVKMLPLGSSNLTEYSAEIRIKPIHLFYIGAGYANYAIKIDPSLASGAPATNITFTEPYAVLGVEF
jgi:outer membrane protein